MFRLIQHSGWSLTNPSRLETGSRRPTAGANPHEACDLAPPIRAVTGKNLTKRIKEVIALVFFKNSNFQCDLSLKDIIETILCMRDHNWHCGQEHPYFYRTSYFSCCFKYWPVTANLVTTILGFCLLQKAEIAYTDFPSSNQLHLQACSQQLLLNYKSIIQTINNQC